MESKHCKWIKKITRQPGGVGNFIYSECCEAVWSHRGDRDTHDFSDTSQNLRKESLKIIRVIIPELSGSLFWTWTFIAGSYSGRAILEYFILLTSLR